MKLVIISKEVFGNTDFMEFSKIAIKKGYAVDYICQGIKPCVTVPAGVNIIDVTSGFTKINFFYSIYIFTLLLRKYDKSSFFHLRHYTFCSLLSLLRLFDYDICCDVRSGCVSKSNMYNKMKNILTRIELKCFKHISILSEGIAKKIFKLHKYQILPLGANSVELSKTKNRFNDPIKFVYVGTLFNREIPKLIKSFESACVRYRLNYTLDIFGSGDSKSVSEVESVSSECRSVVYRGYLERALLADALTEFDIGISFIPIIENFDLQPPTKNFEYLFSGLPVIATSTTANCEVVEDGQNGWLVDDGEDALVKFFGTCAFNFIPAEKCVESVSERTWENIFENYYMKLVNSVKC